MPRTNEELEVRDEGSYHSALTTLSEARLPTRLLARLMNSLEGYRASRKLGWSRPWNKYGVTTFLALRLRPAGEDAAWLAGALDSVIAAAGAGLDAEARAFIAELRGDPDLLGFLFLHESEVDGTPCEGLTLSLGRKVQRRYRDRLDLRFDLPLTELREPGALRVALYLDPWRGGVTPPLVETALAPAALAPLFDRLCALAWQWQADESRPWDHWTSRYIDYFGPRRQRLTACHLPLAGAARLPPLTALADAA